MRRRNTKKILFSIVVLAVFYSIHYFYPTLGEDIAESVFPTGGYATKIKIFEESVCESSSISSSDNFSNFNPTFIDKWGSFGTDGGKFGYPKDIAIDSQSNVYVVDSGLPDIHRVQKFSSDGTFLSEWGTMGTSSGEFLHPAFIAIDNKNQIYVYEIQNNRIQKFSTDGKFITSWGEHAVKNYSFRTVLGLSVDAFNYIYVLDKNALDENIVVKFSDDGKIIATWSLAKFDVPQISSSVDIATDVGGHIYILESNGKLQKFDCNGNFLNTIDLFDTGSFPNPENIFIDQNGLIHITTVIGNQVLTFSNDGNLVKKWGSKGSGDGQFVGAGNISVDSEGNIYVIDKTHGRIQKFSSIYS